MSKSLSFRPDIDGLRAVAVLIVILYQSDLAGMSGGVVGVDVFFVISGFLISGLIATALANETFSFSEFFIRRIRRLLPALSLVIVACMLAGWFLLMPGDYEDLGHEAIWTISGASNIFFLKNTDYFDQAAELMPLLHTWSLSVEIQFYLVWPVVLWFVSAKFKSPRALLYFVASVLAVSLCWSVVSVANDPKTAFFSLHTRAWELSAGYRRLEADATLDLFADSDFGLGTDQEGFVVRGSWALVKNLWIEGSWFSARTIDLIDATGTVAPPIDTDTFMLDLNVRF